MSSTAALSIAPVPVALAIGVDPNSMKILREALPLVEFRELPMDISNLLKKEGEAEPTLIFCGRLDQNVDLVEVATGVRSIYAEAPLYYISCEREGFDQQAFIKNGFADAFLLPMDKGVLRGLIPEGATDYKEVPLIEISPDTVLEFDTYVYLPLNEKYIRFSSAGFALAANRAQRLLNHEIRSVYIAQEHLPAYVKFTANQLKKISTNLAVSESERKQMMHKAVRSLLSTFLNDNSAIQDYSDIVKTYILETSEDPLYERMLKFSAGGGDAYSHVSNVSALASLFSLALNIGKVEEIALAGLLHDIGLADVPMEVQEKASKERTEAEQRAYQQHPLLALDIIKKRQIELSTRVLKIIEEHHERWDASGYPKELRGENIMIESQLLAIADELEYLTQIKSGKLRVSIRAAAQDILTKPSFNPDLAAKILDLLKPN